jgi:hypothetical protein
MGIRFQKRIKVLPGVTVNLSRSGVSTSLGPQGAKVTLGHGQRRTTVGLPGTGLSMTEVKRTEAHAGSAALPGVLVGVMLLVLVLLWGVL